MFKPYKEGTIEKIQGIECHLPRQGYIRNPLTGREEYIGVYARAKNPDFQFWERDKNLANTPDWDKECRKRGITPEEHTEYAKHLEKWWKYRLGGYWFMNNGVPTYITGANWYYLSVYHLDIGLPKYRDIDRQYFYLWKWVQENPKCYGLAEITKRRCLSPDTKVLMYDKKYKLAKDIIVGDKVMGDDFSVRNVLRTTNGIDNMYKITLSNGDYFKCNELHYLYCEDNMGVRYKFEAGKFYNLSITEQKKYYQVKYLGKKQRLYSFKIEYIGDGEFCGFTLDGNNRHLLYNKIITYNSGKSFRAGSISLEEASRRDNFMVGIQSKTDTDAEKFFKKNIINPFRKMPLCFKPSTNLPASGKAPMSELKFENPKMEDYSDELMSAIDYQSSTIGAYDGQKLGLYVGDEFGKLVGVNVNDRWDVVKFCLRDEEGNIIGKTIHTSTVEKERLKSGKTKSDDDTCDKNALEMWNASNQEKVDENGETKSGLIRFFVGGDYTRYLDKFGFADRVKGYNAIMAERAKLKDNPRALANLIRKEPLTDREAFQADGDTCIFGNPVIIQQRFDDLMFLPKQFKEGNFHWVDGRKDGDVYFEECEGGRFWVAIEPPEQERNRIKARSYSDAPDNKEHFCAGIDPFDYKIVQNGSTRGLSKGSLSIVKKDDPLNPTRFDNGIACLYLQRPPLPETFYEDCIKALKYYGCEALIERNKGDIIKYMKERGYEEFVAWLPNQDERGIYNSSRESGGGVNGMITEVIDQWIGGGLDNIVFPILLEQLLQFDPTNTTKFDAAMSYGYALLLYKNTVRSQNRKKKASASFSTDVSGWF